MGLSYKSHGKRSDKETQSPMLKIFKDMMQKERRDPEKTNLLREKHHDRKRKHYSGSRSKSGRQALSSSSDHQKTEPYKVLKQETRNAELDSSQHTLPFQGEKRESWWFWGDSKGKKSDAEDTCSCVSCALKKLISTDYACIACVTILLVVSVAIAIMLVYKSIPCTVADRRLSSAKILSHKTDSERLKRKIGSLGKWSFGPKKQWRNMFRRDDEPDLGGLNFQGNEVSSLVESENELSKVIDSDKMSDIQHSDRLRDFYKKLVQTDAAIRNLRKSLNDNAYTSTNNFDINSSIDINNNFDMNNNYDINSNMDFNGIVDMDNIDMDRIKRSINFHPGKLFHFKKREPGTQSKINNGKLITKSTINMTSNKKSNDKNNRVYRNKRFGNFTDEGLIIEKNKVMIQYKPSRIVPKCSHSPKDSKSHEKELTHPFYKNTQRLDELLDQFIDKNLPDLLADRLNLGMSFDKNKKCKHPVNKEVIIVKDDDLQKDYEENQTSQDLQKDSDAKDYPGIKFKNNQNTDHKLGTGKVVDKEERTTVKTFVIAKEVPKDDSKAVKHSANVFENDFFEDSDGVDKINSRSSTSGYDILLSISTLINPAKKTTSKLTTTFADRPNLRKLLQTNMKAEDGVAYEDIKEVLADYKEGHEDENKESDRRKRNDDVLCDTQVKVSDKKHFPIGVHNANWKGPMPLYPDELTQMTIQGQEPDNKVEVPVHNRDSAPESDDLEPTKTDVEYVEDYLDNGYERLVELAQAYSDYGVLNGKKDTTAEKKASDTKHLLENRKAGISMKRLKSSIKRGLKKKHLFDNFKQGRDLSEGIRIEIQPNPKDTLHPSDNTGIKFKEMLKQHVKILDSFKPDPIEYTLLPELTSQLEVSDLNLPITTTAKANKGFDPKNNIKFKKRTLKAADLSSVNDATDTMGNQLGHFEISSLFQRDKDAEKVEEFKGKTDPTISLDKNINKRITDNLQKMPKKIDKTALFVTNTDLENMRGIKSEATLKESKTKEGESSLSNFFMLLSEWFSEMDVMNVGAKNMSKVIPSDKKTKLKKHDDKSAVLESQLAYPVYDFDMIENIGHRSRVLLSIKSTNNTEKPDKEDHSKSNNEESQIAKVPSSTKPMNIINSTRSVHELSESVNNKATISNETNKRMVKRQAIDDSNLIFWNDLYDEEYGINADPIENNLRDKHSADKNDLTKKSNSWIHDKMKKITDRFYPSNSAKAPVENGGKDGSKHVKRYVKYDSDDDDETGKLDLAALTQRMKAVCKETIKAVQDTKHIEVREDKKEGQAATSLMQQLVRLMTDLVDYQVQERTCHRLPPDLQSFLEWLTSSKEDDTDPGSENRNRNEVDHYALEYAKLDKPTEQDLLLPSERENTDSKTDCLGTLHAVQNLIREYEEMTEDDKSVMTGVKNYLENQMHFLQRQLSSVEDYKYLSQGSRFRRDLMNDLGHTVTNTIDETAQQLEKQYKTLKKSYHQYKEKIGPAYKKALKTSAGFNKAVTDIAHKLRNPGSYHKAGKHQHAKIENKHQKVLKINDKTPEKLKQQQVAKNIKHKHHSLSKFSLKNKAHTKDKVGMNAKRKYNNEDDLDFGINSNHAFRDIDERNIKDVYFKAVEDAKKLSMSKGAHKRDSDTFDKTDIFRVNDYKDEN